MSQANFSPSLEYHVPDLHFPDAPFVELAAGVREVADGIPTMALAKIPDVEIASRLIDEGTADLIGMSRAWLADSQLMAKVRNGETPRPCVYCNVCWDFIHTGRAVSCIYAPETGRESAHPPFVELSPTRRRAIHVIGAGPAGLEAARVAAENGHEVEVHEASDHIGGRLAWEATVPGREAMGKAADWLQGAAERAGVRFHLNEPVDDALLRSWDEDSLVLVASGAAAIVEPVPGATTLSLRAAWDGRQELTGPIIIVDEMEEDPVYSVATELARSGLEVHLMTRHEALGRRMAYISRIGMQRRLDEYGIRVHPLLQPVEVLNGQLIAAQTYSQRHQNVCAAATVVRAGPYVSNVPFAPDRPGVHIIGDASAPRDYVAVSQEANRVAHALLAPFTPTEVAR